jgi:hypothetical protein
MIKGDYAYAKPTRRSTSSGNWRATGPRSPEREDHEDDDRCEVEEKDIMSTDPDPFEQGQRAARDNIPAEANPYADGSEQHALWAAGHEQIAGSTEADEQEGGS